jgi:TM2 domain-containing membrane protein YozV
MTQPMAAATEFTPQQQAAFHARMSVEQKDEVAGVLFAFFLGTFGVHHFYLRRNGLGTLYALFFWTGIPTLLGFIECFFMPGRVRRYNLQQAQMIASTVAAGGYPDVPEGAPLLTTSITCPNCGAGNVSGVRFCSRCGTGLTAS